MKKELKKLIKALSPASAQPQRWCSGRGFPRIIHHSMQHCWNSQLVKCSERLRLRDDLQVCHSPWRWLIDRGGLGLWLNTAGWWWAGLWVGLVSLFAMSTMSGDPQRTSTHSTKVAKLSRGPSSDNGALQAVNGAFPLAHSEHSRASVFYSFLWMLSLNACAVHYGIESSAEKALRAAESIKDFGHSSTLCKYRAKNAGWQSTAKKRRRWNTNRE